MKLQKAIHCIITSIFPTLFVALGSLPYHYSLNNTFDNTTNRVLFELIYGTLIGGYLFYLFLHTVKLCKQKQSNISCLIGILIPILLGIIALFPVSFLRHYSLLNAMPAIFIIFTFQICCFIYTIFIKKKGSLS